MRQLESTRRTQQRRRTIVRGALVAYALAALTACIFDQSTYQGGGRGDQGGLAREQTSASSSASDEPTATTTSTTQADTGSPVIIQDGGAG